MSKKSRYIPISVRFNAMLANTGKCPICGEAKSPPEFDHCYIPHSVYPVNTNWNVRICCRDCNNMKSDKMENKVFLDTDKLWPHQIAMMMALDVYPYVSASGERQASVIYSATSSGKTLLLIMFALSNWNKDKRTLITVPNIATCRRYNEEWAEMKNKCFFGKDLPDKLPELNGRSKGADWNIALANSGITRNGFYRTRNTTG